MTGATYVNVNVLKIEEAKESLAVLPAVDRPGLSLERHGIAGRELQTSGTCRSVDDVRHL